MNKELEQRAIKYLKPFEPTGSRKENYNKYVKSSTKAAQKKFSFFVFDIRERKS